MERARAMVLRTAALLCATSAGTFGASSVAAADFELGRYLATECVTCHRSASTQGAIPNIYGLPETTFAEVLKAYREMKLPNPIMQSISSRLSNEDIAALALYFAKSNPPN